MMGVMDFDWEKLQQELKELAFTEKIDADIDKKYASIVNDITKEKFPEWKEKLGPTVRDIVATNKDEPQAAAEVLILVILQIIHHLAQHKVLFEYGERFNNKVIHTLTALDKRTAQIAQALIERGILSAEDLADG